ncbi:hypothetical protein OCS_06429 [Ophiocordyceps sinensis CO18]|uniref:Uncharacterized protein n=1 Tax=Ophiocordyceps sinensis (strain Co18 / CGMCC 3.14243) TaxID=911162 RepID=T5A7Y5_OPHSC|nr:hypothetical protein OCS_06429 [Ophiocordyceps sinensis CO18]
MEDASSVCGGTETRNSPRAAEEESTASRELRAGPNMDGDSPEVQGDDGPRQGERLEPLQERAWQTRAEEGSSDANDQAAAPSHWHSAPPSPIQTPLPRPREAPRAKTTGKRHRICKLPLSPRVATWGQTWGHAGKRRRTTEGPRQEEEAEVESDEPWSSGAESEEALAGPERPLRAGTPSGRLLRLRDLQHHDHVSDHGSDLGMMDLDMADQESLAGDAERPRTTTPSQIQAQENEHSKSEEDHPGRASDAPSRLDNRSDAEALISIRSIPFPTIIAIAILAPRLP